MNGDTPDPKLIHASCLGAELEDKECQILAGIMVAHHLHDGQDLMKVGAIDPRLVVVAEGELSVISVEAGQEHVVYTMGRGECAGTRAFVDRTSRKATLRAIGDVIVYTMTPDAFESLLDKYPHLIYKAMRALFRVTHTNLMRMDRESEQLTNYIHHLHGRY